jgi:hypothetical protein
MIKEINKVYDKGVITKNGDIEPYEFNSIWFRKRISLIW